MKTYNSFNEMFNDNTKQDMSIFNEIYYEGGNDSDFCCPIGSYFVSIGGHDYLSIACYRDSDIRDAEEGGYAYDPNGWSGILILNNYALSRYNYNFEYADCEKLYKQIMDIVQKYTRTPLDEQYDLFDIHFNRMLSKSEARKLAQKIDNCIDKFIGNDF